MTRAIFAAEVKAARHAQRISIAAPSDFKLAARQSFAGIGARDPLLPYCLDPLRRRSLYVSGPDVESASAAPFYYLHLRRTARYVISVPWEKGALAAPAKGALPILVFSPGRVGSTLLSSILFEARIANMSEPDFYTQMTQAFAASPFNPLRQPMRRAVLAMGRDLVAAFGEEDGPVVAKLRAECSRAPWLILDGARPKTIFMTRRFESWARSTGRVFRAGPRRAVAKYLQSLRGLSWIGTNTQCHVVLYDSLVAESEKAGAALAAFLGRPIPHDAMARALARDAQQGTPLEQGARPDRPGSEQVLAETLALWRSDKVRRIRATLPLFEDD